MEKGGWFALWEAWGGPGAGEGRCRVGNLSDPNSIDATTFNFGARVHSFTPFFFLIAQEMPEYILVFRDLDSPRIVRVQR